MKSILSSSRSARCAFTLIELLIVVAIIAILAAIALPNLLEAQVRSKVSRSKADIRTMATALEAYAVDHNRYPTYHYFNGALHFYMGGEVLDFAVSPPFNGANPLTTPIAYVSSVPNDVFATREAGDPNYVLTYHYVNWPYAIMSVSAPSRRASFEEAYRTYGPYRLHSRGPDQTGPDGITYDPTNGTASNGDVLYSPRTGFDRYSRF